MLSHTELGAVRPLPVEQLADVVVRVAGGVADLVGHAET